MCPLSGFDVTPGSSPLAATTLDLLRRALVDEKRWLSDHSQRLAQEATQLAAERTPMADQLDDAAPETGTIDVERDRLIVQSESTRELVTQIDHALARMRRGRYGTCIPAGRKLPLPRLRAIPWAQVCVDCQEHASRRHTR